jgi:cysteine desulfurase
VLLMNLDLVCVAYSTGSACSSGSLLPSPVLQAMRFSLIPQLILDEIDEAARRLSAFVSHLRRTMT